MNEEVNIIEEQKETPEMEELRSEIEERFAKSQTDNMILGFRVAARHILGMIVEFENSPGKKSNNDHKRLIKKIKEFCNRGLSTENKSEEDSETAQN